MKHMDHILIVGFSEWPLYIGHAFFDPFKDEDEKNMRAWNIKDIVVYSKSVDIICVDIVDNALTKTFTFINPTILID